MNKRLKLSVLYSIVFYIYIDNQTAICKHALWSYIQIKYIKLLSVNIIVYTYGRGFERFGGWSREKIKPAGDSSMESFMGRCFAVSMQGQAPHSRHLPRGCWGSKRGHYCPGEGAQQHSKGFLTRELPGTAVCWGLDDVHGVRFRGLCKEAGSLWLQISLSRLLIVKLTGMC